MNPKNLSDNAILPRILQYFILGGSLILFATSILKLFSLLINKNRLGIDPLFSFLTIRETLFLTSVLEFVVGLLVLRLRPALMRAGLMAWLATVFLTYRIGLWKIGFKGPCHCAGSLGDWVPGHDGTIAFCTEVALFYLLATGYGVLAYMLFAPKAGFSQITGSSNSCCSLNE